MIFLSGMAQAPIILPPNPPNVMKQGGKIDDDCADNDTKAGFITLFFAYLVGCLGCGVGKMFISLVYFLLKICGYIGLLN